MMNFMMKIVKRRTFKKILIATMLAMTVILFIVFQLHLDLKSKSLLPIAASGTSNEKSEEKLAPKQFDSVVKYINEFNPDVSVPISTNFFEEDTTTSVKDNSVGYYISKGENIGCWENDVDRWHMGSYNYLSQNFLIINDNVKERIKESHNGIITSLNEEEKMPYLGEAFYKGNGIVIAGGDIFSLMVFSVIRVIRATGTTLPIEVVIPDLVIKESDIEFCSMIEEYDSKCIFLKNHFSQQILSTTQFKGFQYKSLALLVSSFQNVLLLDADDYPLKNIDDIFDNKVFRDNGMIVWPDFWRRTTHPFFYESANITINFSKRVRNFIDSFTKKKNFVPEDSDVYSDIPYHDFEGTMPDPASETGQFMIDKKKHWKSLILSFYYNTFGPNLYYHLMSQYSAGQGDKETFLTAAHTLHLPYYQVISSPTMDGLHMQDGSGFRSTAYYQKDFRNDNAIKSKLANMKGDILDTIKSYSPLSIRENYFSSEITEDHAIFAHCNLPKYNPIEMAFNNEFVWEGEHYRGLSHKKCLLHVDLEKEIIESYHKVLCASKKTPFDQLIVDYKKIHKEEVCQYLSERREVLTEKLY